MPNLSTLNLPTSPLQPAIPVKGVAQAAPQQKFLSVDSTGRVPLAPKALEQTQKEIEAKNPVRFTLSELGQKLKAERPDLFDKYDDEELGTKLLERKPELGAYVIKPEEKDGFITSLLKGMAHFPVKAGVTIAGATPWVGHDTKDNESTDSYGLDANGGWQGTKVQDNTVNVPLYGKEKPYGEALARGEVKKGLMDIVGGGFEGASLGLLGPGSSLGKNLGKEIIKDAGLSAMGAAGYTMQDENSTIGDVLTNSAIGAGFGTVFGAAMPVGSKILGKGTGVTAEALDRTGSWVKAFKETKMPVVESRVLKPVAATELRESAKRAGLEPKLLDLIDNGTKADAEAMFKMVDVAENSTKSYMSAQPSDVAAESVLQRVNHLKDTEMAAGKELGNIVKKMPKKQMDVLPVLQDYVKDLEGMGVRVRDPQEWSKDILEGRKPAFLDFTDSSLSGVTAGPSQKMLEKTFEDLYVSGKAKLLPQRIHTLRQSLFSDLGLGKANAELGERADVILQNVRKNLMKTLSNGSKEYAKASRTYAMAEEALTNFDALMGRKFSRVTGESLKRRAGEVSSRILGNASADAKRVIDILEETARVTGFKAKDNMERQLIFADALKEIFDITRPRSFQGGVERGVEKALEGAGMAYDLAKGNWIGAGTKLVSKALGRTPEKQREILRKLLLDKLKSTIKLKPRGL